MHEFSIDQSFTAAGATVTPIRVMHGRLPIAGFRIGDLAYMTDLFRPARQRMAEIARRAHGWW